MFKLIFKHLLKSPSNLFFTIVASGAALCLLGAVWMIVDSLEIVKISQNKTNIANTKNGFTVFVDADLKKHEVVGLTDLISSKPSIKKVETLQSEDVVAELKDQFGENVSGAFSKGELPINLKVFFDKEIMTRQDYNTLLSEIKTLPGVLGVDDGLAVVSARGDTRLNSGVFSWASWFFLMVFVVISLLVSHMIRLIFESMKTELETLKVLGAPSTWMIPAVLAQGLIFGFFGACFAIISLQALVMFFSPQLYQSILPADFGPLGISLSTIGGLFLVGIVASLVGSFMTVPAITRKVASAK